MEFIALRKFGGEIPRLPADLLPEYAAQQALFCDFSRGSLAPLKQGTLLATMTNLVKSIYTDDGINFYTWPEETWPCKSPVMKDPYGRIYYLESGVLRATTSAGLSPTGGPPSASWKVGVPRPTVAPVLALVDHGGLRDYPGASMGLSAWYEDGGAHYQEGGCSLTEVTALRKFSFTAPSRAGGTPSTAVVRVTFTISYSGSEVMSATFGIGDPGVKSLTFPGGVTFTLTSGGGDNYVVTLSWGTAETRAYTYTALNTWNEESAPSPPAQISTDYLQDVQVTLPAISSPGGVRPIFRYRTCRTMGSNAAYLRVRESSDTVFTDSSSKASDVLGTLDTIDYEEPPAYLDAMVRLPGGSLAGFHGSEVYISEVYTPHTWQYQVSFPKNVRGLCAAPGSVVVTTAEFSYALVGVDPASMQPVELPVPQAGIAQRSMAKLIEATAYASHDGIVSVTGVQAGMTQSQELFTRDTWRARYGGILSDASIRFAHHDGALVATSSTSALGFLLRTDESVAGQLSQFNERMDSMFQLPVADTLYYSVGTDVYSLRTGAAYTYTWWSRDYIWNAPRNLGAGYIRCSAPVTLTTYMNGVLWESKTVSSGYFRLKPGRKGLRWSVKLEGTAEVHELYLARTFDELTNG